MIDEKIKNLILNKLEQVESEYSITIPFACESGSRGWGFPSQDSDYDVRFIYVHKRDWYLSIEEKKDILEFAIVDDLDIGGWDIRKVLQRIRRSNPVICEWLQSPILYKCTEDVRKSLLELAAHYFSEKKSIHHYLGISKKGLNEMSERNELKIKKIFYVIRPLLAALWIAETNTIPPMELSKLRVLIEDDRINSKIDSLLEQKHDSKESTIISIDPVIKEYVHITYDLCKQKSEALVTKDMPVEKLDAYFQGLLKNAGR